MYEQLGLGKDEDQLHPVLVEYVENAYFVVAGHFVSLLGMLH